MRRRAAQARQPARRSSPRLRRRCPPGELHSCATTNGRSNGSKSPATSVSRKNGSVIPSTPARRNTGRAASASAARATADQVDPKSRCARANAVRQRRSIGAVRRGARVRAAYSAFSSIRRGGGDVARAVRRHASGVELQPLDERHAPVVQSPHAEEHEIQRGAQVSVRIATCASRARPRQPPRVAARERDPRRDDEEPDRVDEGKRRLIRRAGEQRAGPPDTGRPNSGAR